jgi:hypothetical protein
VQDVTGAVRHVDGRLGESQRAAEVDIEEPDPDLLARDLPTDSGHLSNLDELDT